MKNCGKNRGINCGKNCGKFIFKKRLQNFFVVNINRIIDGMVNV